MAYVVVGKSARWAEEVLRAGWGGGIVKTD